MQLNCRVDQSVRKARNTGIDVQRIERLVRDLIVEYGLACGVGPASWHNELTWQVLVRQVSTGDRSTWTCLMSVSVRVRASCNEEALGNRVLAARADRWKGILLPVLQLRNITPTCKKRAGAGAGIAA